MLFLLKCLRLLTPLNFKRVYINEKRFRNMLYMHKLLLGPYLRFNQNVHMISLFHSYSVSLQISSETFYVTNDIIFVKDIYTTES